MNIFNRVALQGLLKSRARTLVTIIGAALSAALFTGVAIFAVSLQQYMIHGAEGNYGGWHLEVYGTDAEFAESASQNDRVAGVSTFEDIGYAYLDGGQNADKPYLFIAGFHEDTFADLPLNVLYGRLPENSGEVMIPAHVEANGGVEIALGDILDLSVGERQTLDGETLTQHDPFRGEEEILLPEGGKTYTVVGIYRRPPFEIRSAPGYTAITAITAADASAQSNSRTAFITLQKPVQTRSFAKKALEGRDYTQNDNVLRFTGVSDDKMFNTMLYSAGGVLLALIMLGSVFMIYNSFNISLNERTHQFGILMSVGATEKQLRGSVLFEGFCIGALGIPLGILLAIPAVKAVLALAAKNFANILYAAPLTLAISAPAIIAAAVISLATILISAYIPARKAAAVPVMECIRQTNEIKTDAKTLKAMKTPKHAARLYGLEATLAIKNFRRNKRRYRSIILSLTFSVVLFVAASYFKVCLVTMSDRAKVVTDFDISLGAPGNYDNARLENIRNQMKTASGVTHSSCRVWLECSGAVRTDDLSDAYWGASGARMSGENTENTEMIVQVMIITDDFYREIVTDLGLPAEEYGFGASGGKLLSVAKMNATGYVEGPEDLDDMFARSDVLVTLTPRTEDGKKLGTGTEVTAGIHTFLPPDTASSTGKMTDVPYFFQILAPWSMLDTLCPEGAAVLGKGIAFRSDTPGQTTGIIKEMMRDTGTGNGFSLYNLHQLTEDSRNILFVADLFTLVFVAMISLIAVANVFNTISTNIRLRRRELAMLRSVGMSDGDFGKMMRFECALYGLRTLIFGLPLSLLVSWLIYFGMTFKETEKFPFKFPWGSLGISMAGVFLVIFITMLYATSKIRKENIIDALRDELT